MFTAVILSGLLYAFASSPNGSINGQFQESLSEFFSDSSKTAQDSTKKDTTKLIYPIQDNPLYGEKPKNNIDLKDPEILKTEVVYDTATGKYTEKQLIGDENYRPEEEFDYQEYLRKTEKQEINEYFKQRSQASSFVRGGGLIPPINVGPKIFDKIFGGGTIDIRPQGSAELIFGWNYNVVRNPALTARQQRNGQFDFRQKIQINLTGSIGDRLKLGVNYDTEATFEFDNQMKLDWEGGEDDILKKVELGNVSLPLNSSLINGGQSLFGVKAQLQFGRVTVTSIFTQQKSETTETQVTGGAQITKFDIQADNYDVNRHFFLAHYFADNYDRFLQNLPAIQSPIIINRVEVWVTNRQKDFATTRDIVGYMDLGEIDPFNNSWTPGVGPYPDNEANSLYNTVNSNQQARSSFETVKVLESAPYNLDKIRDFQFLANARLLNSNEYTFHPQLGYISLNTQLNNDEILAVAFEYTVNGAVYQVGEFSVDVPDNQADPKVLHLKLLKGATITTQYPIWDLMMKNVYSLGAFSIQEDKFYLDVIYADDFSGADYTYLPVQNEPQLNNDVLIKVLNLDRVNVQKEGTPDGVFDFIPGLTINPTNGRIIFPVREPFGSYLASRLNNQENVEKYVYQELYDSTKWLAEQVVLKNKFFLRGSFQSASNNEISLNAFNIPQGSVKVTANGSLLQENVDYIVDYTLGRVKIINSGLLESGAVINVSSENNSLFNIQQKTLVGSRVDFKVNEDLILGGTVMHLWERPLTPKVNIGDEPLLNTIVGFDGSYKTESRRLTKWIDRLPLIETKEVSNITITGEYAQLFPHQPRTIGERGTSFIDDFEGTETPFDLKNPTNWFIASTPEGQPDIFPEANQVGAAASGRRAKLAWYTIDPIFQRDQPNTNPPTPPHLIGNTQSSSNHYTRIIQNDEVFPNRQLQNMQPQNVPTLDLAYYPNERGQYNYNASLLDNDGNLNDPAGNWGGIQRRIETNDFEAANIDYLEMWVMSPFMYDPSIKGTLYINLGQISEDVIKDRAKSFENGLPTDPNIPNQTRSTGIAVIPTGRTMNNAFVNDQAARDLQDLGLDGMNDQTERDTFSTFLQEVANLFGAGSAVYQKIAADPSADNYRFHSSGEYDGQQLPVLDRYKNINGQQGNSPLASFQPDGYPIARTNLPDDEDINGDFSLNTIEEYFQYKIEIDQTKLVPGQNFVADIQSNSVPLPDGTNPEVQWYLLRIPISAFDKKVGGIQDFKSIRFMRMYMRGFDKPVVLRFAQLQLVRAEWRRYLKNLAEAKDSPPTNPADNTIFSTGTVNIEENGFRSPVRYVLPPGFFREVDPTTPANIQQNEQSLSVRVCNLEDGDARGVFKTTRYDVRNYKKLQMFVHAEAAGEPLSDGDLQAFIRIGTDLENNYYEYSFPLTVTTPGSTSAEAIWPVGNRMEIVLDTLYAVKQRRSFDRVPLTLEYTRNLPNGAVAKVKGLPDMSNIRVIMMGVRNPLQKNNPGRDDGLAKCAEVWFNELRVSEFINQGGNAANLRVVTKLADLGTVTGSVNYQSIGFGGIDKKLNERNLNSSLLYDVNGAFELGKFFPAKAGISIPMFIGHSEQLINPKFNPLNPDILLTTAVETAPSEAEAEAIKRNAVDLTVRRSINFTNVRKNRMGAEKPHFYDIENFNVSYSRTTVYHRDQQTAEDLQKTYRGSIGYNFNPQNKPWQPFRKLSSSPWLAIVTEFKLNPLPSSFGTRLDIDRFYSRRTNRNNDNPNTIAPTNYNKNFTLNRYYDFRWDLTGNLSLDYSSVANSRVDEPTGKISREETPDSIQVILDNLRKFGRFTNFNQRFNATYTVPINKIPLFNWVSLNAGYTGNFEWKTAPPATASLGNDIQNSQTYNLVGQFNMRQLYDKIPYFKAVNRGGPIKSKPAPKPKEGEEGKEGDEDKEKKKKEKDVTNGAGPFLARLVMSVKNISFNYTVTKGIYLPGYLGTPQFFGNDFDANAPGMEFILGSQNPNFRFNMAEAGFISRDENVFSQYSQNSTVNFAPKARIEPIRELVIDLNMQRTEINNVLTTFKFDPNTNTFQSFGLQSSGSYTITFNSIRTAFDKLDSRQRSETFAQFENNRYSIAVRLAAEDARSVGIDPTTGFPDGYNRNNQTVMMHSFLAAYSGSDPSTSNLSIFPRIPFPSWNLTYTGLNRIKWIREYFNNVTLRHAYSSTYAVSSFRSSINQDPRSPNNERNFYPEFIIDNLVINETFSPLIKIDLGWKNNLTTGVEYKLSRMAQLMLNNGRVNETRRREFVIGLGYKKTGLKINWMRINGKRVSLPNDLNIRMDFSILDTKTLTMEPDDLTGTPQNGNVIVSIKPTIDYNINSKLNLRIFYDRKSTNPLVATSFPTAITSGGISLRYTLQ